jgi:hypothetical protein
MRDTFYACPIYPSRRRAQTRISDNSIMRDVTMETCDLYIFVLYMITSQICFSHSDNLRSLYDHISNVRCFSHSDSHPQRGWERQRWIPTHQIGQRCRCWWAVVGQRAHSAFVCYWLPSCGFPTRHRAGPLPVTGTSDRTDTRHCKPISTTSRDAFL